MILLPMILPGNVLVNRTSVVFLCESTSLPISNLQRLSSFFYHVLSLVDTNEVTGNEHEGKPGA